MRLVLNVVLRNRVYQCNVTSPLFRDHSPCISPSFNDCYRHLTMQYPAWQICNPAGRCVMRCASGRALRQQGAVRRTTNCIMLSVLANMHNLTADEVLIRVRESNVCIAGTGCEVGGLYVGSPTHVSVQACRNFWRSGRITIHRDS
jgi:hypothetical protein